MSKNPARRLSPRTWPGSSSSTRPPTPPGPRLRTLRTGRPRRAHGGGQRRARAAWGRHREPSHGTSRADGDGRAGRTRRRGGYQGPRSAAAAAADDRRVQRTTAAATDRVRRTGRARRRRAAGTTRARPPVIVRACVAAACQRAPCPWRPAAPCPPGPAPAHHLECDAEQCTCAVDRVEIVVCPQKAANRFGLDVAYEQCCYLLWPSLGDRHATAMARRIAAPHVTAIARSPASLGEAPRGRPR